MTTTTRVTMARVAMRAAVWTLIRATVDGPDEAIDSLTNEAVAAVDAVVAAHERERVVAIGEPTV